MLEECVHYLNHLNVPAGYETDLLTITDVPSMTRGYNEAIAASDARYKIYMHQDVFILNKNILADLLAVFKSDPRIGMIGMVGYDTISPNGIMWHKKRLGNLYQRKIQAPYPQLSEYRFSLTGDGYLPAAVIDGFFMATAYDLPWDETHLDGWHFYDAFQSINFLEHGYQIVVPAQTYPWCMHDDNLFPDLSGYDHYRQIFTSVYKKYLGRRYTDILR